MEFRLSGCRSYQSGLVARVSCQERRDLLHGYLDGELDLAATLEIERHLQSCQSCARAYGNQRILRSAIRSMVGTAGSSARRVKMRSKSFR